MSAQKSGRTLFVADLHLAEARPQASARFFRFLESTAAGADALYILGDLFEYWAGDDDLNAPLARLTAERIKALAAAGTPVYFMHGNRDFLLGKRYAGQCGMSLLADPAIIDLYGSRTLLTHGDALCIEDLGYQRYRRLVGLRPVKGLLLALPLALRHALARRARSGSERAKAGKPRAIMDVNAEAVAKSFLQSGAQRMIHGHTHRPGGHAADIGGAKRERWVLPDWYGEGGYLDCGEEGCELLPAPASAEPASSTRP